MKCPSCGFDNPEKAPDCPKCQVIFEKWFEKKARETEGVNIQMPEKPASREISSSFKYALLALGGFAIFMLVALTIQPKPENPAQSSNAVSGSVEKITVISRGERVEIGAFVVKGKVTIFDFYADWCGPCKVIGPKIEALVAEKEDVVVRKIDIVNWESEVAKQYEIQFVPNIQVYDRNGNQVGQSTSDFSQVLDNVASCK